MVQRYNDEGLEGLRDRPRRSGKPSTIPKETMEKIRHELSDSNIGWNIKQVMDLIHQKTGVKYVKNTSADYFISGVFHQKYLKRDS